MAEFQPCPSTPDDKLDKLHLKVDISSGGNPEISPMAAILQARSHLGRSNIPGSPTDKLMSPTSRRLRKNSKTYVDDKYKLHETKNVLTTGHDETSARSSMISGFSRSKIVLGSSSIARKRILESNGWRFSILESNVDMEVEIGKSSDSPLHIALSTAHALLPHFQDNDIDDSSVLITVAQVIECEGRYYHPPQTIEAAEVLLLALSDHRVHTYTAVVATLCPAGFQVHDIDETTISFGKLSDELVKRIVKRSFSIHTNTLPLDDPELRLRCAIESGTRDSAFGMPLCNTLRVIEAVLNDGGLSDGQIPLPPSVEVDSSVAVSGVEEREVLKSVSTMSINNTEADAK